MDDKDRARVVEVAKSWIGTRYAGWSRFKGPRGGVDCMQFLAAVFIEAGLVPEDEVNAIIPKSYSLQIGQHQETTEYLDGIRKFADEIPESEIKAGDVVMYKLKGAFAYQHGAVVVEWPEYVIHCILHGGVSGCHGKNHPLLRVAEKKFFRIKG